MTQTPWSSGPGEILKHALSLLKKDSDINRRLSMILIDNAIELTVKTFLGLPKRINNLSIPRKEFQSMSESFPSLLDGLEKYAPEKLDGVDLGTIEWYHRLRNELYHQGNGLTVEKDKVEIYAEIANLLFKNLFGEELIVHPSSQTELLGEFMSAWIFLEKGLKECADRHSLSGHNKGLIETINFLEHASLLNKKQKQELDKLRRIRNLVMHNQVDYKKVVTPEVIANLIDFIKLFESED